MEISSDLKAKKSLGQNFLKSERALNKIIEIAQLKKGEFVLEIGPGKGALTEKLLRNNVVVIAVEKDRRMCQFLKEKFNKEFNKKLFLLNEDVLELEIDEIFEKVAQISKHNFYQETDQKPPKQKKSTPKKNSEITYKLIANIPYYITGAIIRKFLSSAHQPERMVLLLQKEVAERIVARDQKESLLSISVKAYCQPIFIETVKAGSFVPAPSVDSAIVLFQNISKKNFTHKKIHAYQKTNYRKNEEDLFFEILHAGFAHKRKMLLSNLKEWQKKSVNQKKQSKKMPFESSFKNTDFTKIFEKLNLNPKIRAENLVVKDWLRILKFLI